MELRSGAIERVLKSFGFSVALFIVWSALTAAKARSLFTRFDWLECGWVFYNAIIAILFLIRMRPSVVTMNPLHWLVALVTSFSGLFFNKGDLSAEPSQVVVADALILCGLALGAATAWQLGRSYDFLPALRGVQTSWLYGVVRHPMYLSSIIIRGGYVLRSLLSYNLVVFVLVVWLYDRRARYEEAIMKHDHRYLEYAARVRFRFLPLLY
jgi:protein-S-isoprenylcysteine O-methyltransferase Ste14